MSASNPYAYIYVSRSDCNIKDLGAADFLISVGADLYWLHTTPNSYTSELSTDGLYAQIVTTQKDSTILSGIVMEADNRMRFKIKSEIGNSVLIINAMRNNVYIDSAKSNPS